MNASDPIRIGLILIFVPRNRFILYILQSSKPRLGFHVAADWCHRRMIGIGFFFFFYQLWLSLVRSPTQSLLLLSWRHEWNKWGARLHTSADEIAPNLSSGSLTSFQRGRPVASDQKRERCEDEGWPRIKKLARGTPRAN